MNFANESIWGGAHPDPSKLRAYPDPADTLAVISPSLSQKDLWKPTLASLPHCCLIRAATLVEGSAGESVSVPRQLPTVLPEQSSFWTVLADNPSNERSKPLTLQQARREKLWVALKELGYHYAEQLNAHIYGVQTDLHFIGYDQEKGNPYPSHVHSRQEIIEYAELFLDKLDMAKEAHRELLKLDLSRRLKEQAIKSGFDDESMTSPEDPKRLELQKHTDNGELQFRDLYRRYPEVRKFFQELREADEKFRRKELPTRIAAVEGNLQLAQTNARIAEAQNDWHAERTWRGECNNALNKLVYLNIAQERYDVAEELYRQQIPNNTRMQLLDPGAILPVQLMFRQTELLRALKEDKAYVQAVVALLERPFLPDKVAERGCVGYPKPLDGRDFYTVLNHTKGYCNHLEKNGLRGLIERSVCERDAGQRASLRETYVEMECAIRAFKARCGFFEEFSKLFEELPSVMANGRPELKEVQISRENDRDGCIARIFPESSAADFRAWRSVLDPDARPPIPFPCLEIRANFGRRTLAISETANRAQSEGLAAFVRHVLPDIESRLETLEVFVASRLDERLSEPQNLSDFRQSAA